MDKIGNAIMFVGILWFVAQVITILLYRPIKDPEPTNREIVLLQMELAKLKKFLKEDYGIEP